MDLRSSARLLWATALLCLGPALPAQGSQEREAVVAHVHDYPVPRDLLEGMHDRWYRVRMGEQIVGWRRLQLGRDSFRGEPALVFRVTEVSWADEAGKGAYFRRSQWTYEHEAPYACRRIDAVVLLNGEISFESIVADGEGGAEVQVWEDWNWTSWRLEDFDPDFRILGGQIAFRRSAPQPGDLVRGPSFEVRGQQMADFELRVEAVEGEAGAPLAGLKRATFRAETDQAPATQWFDEEGFIVVDDYGGFRIEAATRAEVRRQPAPVPEQRWELQWTGDLDGSDWRFRFLGDTTPVFRSMARQDVRETGYGFEVLLPASPEGADPLSDSERRRWSGSDWVGPRVRELAVTASVVAGDGATDLERMDAVLTTVLGMIARSTGPAPDSLEAMVVEGRASHLGRCRMAVAICRVLGMPARVTSGLVAVRSGPEAGVLFPFNWCEVHADGRWRILDPGRGVVGDDPAYLSTGSDRIYGLLGLLSSGVAVEAGGDPDSR